MGFWTRRPPDVRWKSGLGEAPRFGSMLPWPPSRPGLPELVLVSDREFDVKKEFP